MSAEHAQAARAPPRRPTQRLGRLLTWSRGCCKHQGVRSPRRQQEFGVDEQQLVDDLELLFVCGTPGADARELIDAQWDGGHVYLGNADDIAPADAPDASTRP